MPATADNRQLAPGQLADLSRLADGTVDRARASEVRAQVSASPRLTERYDVAVRVPAGPSVSQAAALGLRGPEAPAPAPDRSEPAGRLDASLQNVYFSDWWARFGWRATGRREDWIDGRLARTVYYASGKMTLSYTIVSAPALRMLTGAAVRVNGTELRTLAIGAELALIGAGIPVPTTRPLRVRGRSLTSAQIDAVHAYTARGWPAMCSPSWSRGCRRSCSGWSAAIRSARRRFSAVRCRSGASCAARARGSPRADRAFATAVGWILRSPGATVPASEMPAVVRARFEQLRAEEIVELEHRAYRAIG